MIFYLPGILHCVMRMPPMTLRMRNWVSGIVFPKQNKSQNQTIIILLPILNPIIIHLNFIIQGVIIKFCKKVSEVFFLIHPNGLY